MSGSGHAGVAGSGTARELLAAAARRLAEAGVPSPMVDAELLLEHVTGRPRTMLRMSPVGDDQARRFHALVDGRADRVPLQHLTGRAHFRHLTLRVGPGAFVPRPETEPLVGHALRFLGAGGGTVVDLCTGSAAVALALATEAARCRVVAVEISPAALAWARVNVADHARAVAGVGSCLEVVQADATTVADGPLAGLRGRVDVVVSNPPYIPDAAVPRDPEVRDHDPRIALFGGVDGLDVVRPLIRQAASLLRPGGLALVEHADTQGEDAGSRGVPGVFRCQSSDAVLWEQVEDHADLAGSPRFTAAVRTRTPVP